jgi:fused signal recognition particle receptor
LKRQEPDDSSTALTERLRDKLSKTRMRLAGRLNTLLSGRMVIDPTFLEDLEEVLFTSDIGVETTEQLIGVLNEKLYRKSLETPDQVKTMLQEEMVSLLRVSQDRSLFLSDDKVSHGLQATMFIGVNGVGKTTTIAKMAHYLQGQGHTVMLAALLLSNNSRYGEAG